MSLENFPNLLLNISDDDVKPETIHSYRFKSFTLKALERQLFDGDRRISLTPKAFDVLTLLIANAGHLVTKEELLETIWAESFVDEANLARLVHTIRKALSEDENGNKFIETVPTKGYRFVADVEEVIIPLREYRETLGNGSSDEFWPDRLESGAAIDTHPVRQPMAKKASSRWILAGLAIVVVVGLVVAFTAWRNNTSTGTATDRPISIAVLPLRPISTGERDFTNDLAFANSVIADLSSSKNIRVRPFATMRNYTDVTQDPIAIGNEREADYVLESNYLTNAGRMHVTSNLINVKTGSVETFKYVGDASDLYAAGRKIAATIVPDVLAKLNLPAVVPGNRGTENEEAWKSYLHGMNLVNKRTVEDSEKAIDEFRHAIGLDPNYSQAYMGLGYALQSKLINGGERAVLCGPALEAETKALELDPTSGDALAFLATNRRYCDWDLAESEKEYQRAVQLSPNSAHVRRYYAINISTIEGRFDEALEHLELARELEPNNPFNEKLIGRVLFFARRYDDAIAQSVKAKALVPEPEQTSFVYMSYEMKGDIEKAFEWFLVVKQLELESEEELNAWRSTYAELGWQGVLRRRLERALEGEKTVDKINKRVRLLEEITTLSVQLGEYDQAFEYMNKAIDSYVLFGGQIRTNPYYDSVRSDPRYKAIMARTWNIPSDNS